MVATVLSVLEDKVFSGELREGTYFSENDLLGKINAEDPSESDGDGGKLSRAAVREVLAGWSFAGLVEQKPRVGTQIPVFSKAKRDHYFARRIFEERYAIASLIRRLQDPEDEDAQLEIGKLQVCIDRMQKALSSGSKPDIKAFFTADLDFHSSIAVAGGIEDDNYIRTLFVVTFLTTHSRLSLNSDIIKAFSMEKGRCISDHQNILNAINEFDQSSACNLISDHIHQSEDLWTLAISTQQQSEAEKRAKFDYGI